MMGAISAAKGAILAALFFAGVAAGGVGVGKWNGAKIERLTRDLADATRIASGERAARVELTAQCQARDAAASDGESRRDAVRRAAEQAIREADDAAAAGDDGLGALLERLRGDGTPAGTPAGATGRAP